jgi:hypothetical protein
MKDIMKLSVDEVDDLMKQATMTDDERIQSVLETKIGLAFQYNNPEYFGSDANAHLIGNYVAAMGWPVSLASVQKAFENLSAEGALEVKR